MFCEMSGDCELQALASRYGMDTGPTRIPFPKVPVERKHGSILSWTTTAASSVPSVHSGLAASWPANNTLGVKFASQDHDLCGHGFPVRRIDVRCLRDLFSRSADRRPCGVVTERLCRARNPGGENEECLHVLQRGLRHGNRHAEVRVGCCASRGNGRNTNAGSLSTVGSKPFTTTGSGSKRLLRRTGTWFPFSVVGTARYRYRETQTTKANKSRGR